MELKDQVTSLQLSKRLKELGAKQKSYFYWCKIIGTDKWEVGRLAEDKIKSWLVDEIAFSAFTVAELGEMLPPSHLAFFRDELGWYGMPISPNKEWKTKYPCSTEADARALMLIYLLENGLIKNDP